MALANQSAFAQMTDVTSQYIPCPSFETCPAVQPDANGLVSVINHWNTLGGIDYSNQGWYLVEQRTSGNGAVVEYGNKVKYTSYNSDSKALSAPSEAAGSKALCFSGNKSVVYISNEEVTLPAGSYRLTVYVYNAYLATSSMPSTSTIHNASGFVAKDGTEYFSKKEKFATNAWEADVIEILLTETTTGYFQLNYGSQYYIAIDDLKLEYEQKVITTSLEAVIVKAQALNRALGGNSALLNAIGTAQAFVDNPTSQDAVAGQVEQLYDSMAAALSTATTAVNITAAYVDNASFESGDIAPWTGTARATQPSSALPVTPNIDGESLAEFDNDVTSYRLSQSIEHLPAGNYIIDAQIGNRASLVLGTSTTAWKGGSDGLFLRGHSAVVSTDGTGSLVIGATGTNTFSIDNFRLFYAPDAAMLKQAVLSTAQADGRAFLANATYSGVTGSERTALSQTVSNTEGDASALVTAINQAIANLVDAKSDYNKLVTAKQAAAAYTLDAYPYGARSVYETIQQLINTDATSRQNALELRDQLNAATREYYISNAYCEGVDVVDCTSSISGASATGSSIPVAWRRQNMAIRTDKTAWTNPKTSESDQNVYGVTTEYYRTGKDQTAYMYQNVSGLPEGKYVLSVTFMSTATLHPEVLINGETVGTLTGVGVYGGGVYGGGWVENVISFEKANDANMELRFQSVLSANYQEWYFDNVRLYRITGIDDAIQAPSANKTDGVVYDIAGRRVAKPSKGLYIINGRKEIIK